MPCPNTFLQLQHISEVAEDQYSFLFPFLQTYRQDLPWARSNIRGEDQGCRRAFYSCRQGTYQKSGYPPRKLQHNWQCPCLWYRENERPTGHSRIIPSKCQRVLLPLPGWPFPWNRPVQFHPPPYVLSSIPIARHHQKGPCPHRGNQRLWQYIL